MSLPSIDLGSQTIKVKGLEAEAGVLTPLRFERMTGTEALSDGFEYEIDLRSENDNISMVQVLGKPFAVSIQRGLSEPRWFNGIVARFTKLAADDGHPHYRLKLVPLMWLMTRTSN
jgi:type VI secretion system secreted protein VgrG